MTLIQKISRESNLKKAWERIYSGKSDDVRLKSRGSDNVTLVDFKANLKSNLKEISELLKTQNYHMSKLEAFSQKKDNGTHRLITAPTVNDRVVHASILAEIQKYYPEIRNGSSYCLPKSKLNKKVGPVDAFRQIVHQVKKGNIIVFESDIEGFFDNVNKSRLLKKILRSLPDESINNLLKEIVYFDVRNLSEFKKLEKKGKIRLPKSELGLSQGSPLSPLFSNIYLSRFDTKLIKSFGKRYIRYVDDFIIMCKSNNESETALKTTKTEMENDELSIPPIKDKNDSKTKVKLNLKNGAQFKFLGINVSREEIRPVLPNSEAKEYLDKKCLAFGKIKKTLESKNKPHGDEEVSEISNRLIQSKFGGWGYYHTKETLDELNEMIKHKSGRQKLIIKTISSKKKGMPIVNLETWNSYFS